MQPWKLMIVLAMATLVASCAGTRAAYEAAEGLEEKAYVVAEHYYALVREGNDLKNRGILTGTQLERTQDLVRQTRPIVLELTDTVAVYNEIRSADTEAILERALNRAAVAVSRLVDAIKAVRPSTSENQHGPIDHRLDRAA